MKTFLVLSILCCFSLSAFSATELARIEERTSPRTLIYAKDGDHLLFSVSDGIEVKEIKRLTYHSTSDSVQISGDQDVYHFEFLKTMTNATASAYDWCWSPHPSANQPSIDYMPALSGTNFAMIGVIGSLTLCATVPGVPFLVGVIAAPVDGVLTLGDRLLDRESIAARKFAALLRGETSIASHRVFKTLIQKISEL